MAKSIPVTATKSYLLGGVRNTLIKAVALAGAAATSVLEIFDGGIDAPATVSVSVAGSLYEIGDLLTLVAGENGNEYSRAVVRVTQIDYLSPSTSISSSPSTSVSSSVSLSVSPSSSQSPSPSTSLSVSTSISSSPSASLSVSTSISSSPSLSISSSVSLSRSSSISASPSASPSPSGTGSGGVTEVEIITPGGGYTAGNTYATESSQGGSGATIKVLTVTDAHATSVAKLQTTANLSAAPLVVDCGILTTKGISARISGTDAKGHLVYE
jgi:hypothetical protein